MFLLTLVKIVPFQLFLLLPNVLFDQASLVSFHLLSYGGRGDLSNVLFKLGQCAAHIGMGGVKIKKEPRQRDEYVYRIS